MFLQLPVIGLLCKPQPFGCLCCGVGLPVLEDFLQHLVGLFLLPSGMAGGAGGELLLVNVHAQDRVLVRGDLDSKGSELVIQFLQLLLQLLCVSGIVCSDFFSEGTGAALSTEDSALLFIS